MRRKAQMEIMGLAIIVILLSLGFLFVVRFMLLKQPSTVTQDYKESQLATNFLNTLLETSAPECQGIQLDTLFQDCAEYGDDGKIKCNGQSSCDYIHDTTYNILEDTLEEWRVQYYFFATTDPENLLNTNSSIIPPVYPTGVDCNERLQGTQPLPSSPPVHVILYICQ